MKIYRNLLLSLVYFLCTSKAEDELISVVEMFRHGHRTPSAFTPGDPYKDPKYWNGLGEGELTEKGWQQLYYLGLLFKQRYKDLLSNTYDPKEIKVTSSDNSRNKNSSKAFLSALYGDIDVPIIVEKPLASQIVICLKFDVEYKTVETTDPKYVTINNNNRELYQYLSDNSKGVVNDLFSASSLFDTLRIEREANLQLPKWTKALTKKIMFEIDLSFINLFCNSKEMIRLGIGPLINRIIEHFENLIQGREEPKTLIFSFHDLNILCFVHAFEYPIIFSPGFASNVVFELRRNKNTGRYFVKTFYTHSIEHIPVPLSIPGCSLDCDLDSFKDHFADIRLSNDQWYSECRDVPNCEDFFPGQCK